MVCGKCGDSDGAAAVAGSGVGGGGGGGCGRGVVKAVLFDVYFLDDVYYVVCFHFLFCCYGSSISRWLDA